MADKDNLFAGSIPQVYERLFVPMIFAPYAQDMADRVARFGPRGVLELAAGTGVVTRALCARLEPEARIVVTDLNPAMLAQARSVLPADARLEWRVADALALPFEPACFDAVVCQFGAMFFPDKVRGYAEARRVLRPGGRFFFNVWDRLSENEVTAAVSDALDQMFPADPIRFMQRTPHGYFDVDRIRGELESAGFAAILVDARGDVSRAPSALDAARAHCEGTPLRNEIEKRAPGRLAEATALVAGVLAERFGQGPISGRIRAFVFEATV